MPFLFPVSPLSQVFWHCDQIKRVHEWAAGASLLPFLCDCTDQWNREDSGPAEGGRAGSSCPADQGSSRLWWKWYALHEGVALSFGVEECVCLCTLQHLTWALQSSGWLESVRVCGCLMWCIECPYIEKRGRQQHWKQRAEIISVEERGEKTWESWRNSKGKRDYSFRSLKFFNCFRNLLYLKATQHRVSCWGMKKTAIEMILLGELLQVLWKISPNLNGIHWFKTMSWDFSALLPLWVYCHWCSEKAEAFLQTVVWYL